ncbi:PIN domain-containing protein [Gaiella occulta]|uniref:Ribonuclease VapC n=1 Tax=Gaiella occulta TaxID=1002870 RepID=A0A7M2YU20_9ACTN|nr:TA system VapC family ribonuclease toxin [Gaiella occulta]RDI73240.1 PIN domain-containing protein [Gaiella occulta]
MSAAIDVNPLLYASDTSSPFHGAALAFVERIAAGRELVYLFWPTAMAYLRIATHPSIFASPLSSREAVANLTALLGLPHVRSPGEDADFWAGFRVVADEASPRGNLFPDAHIVALMRANGVESIWTRDRDYFKFAGIKVLDPFAPAPAQR